jgi:hypothetical protein
MMQKLTPLTRRVEGRLRQDSKSTAHLPGSFQKKPPQSAHERPELCSAFLAERGCLTTHPARTPRTESAA